MYLSSFAGNTHPDDVLVRVLSLPDCNSRIHNIIPLGNNNMGGPESERS